jgi:hypothetical protein
MENENLIRKSSNYVLDFLRKQNSLFSLDQLDLLEKFVPEIFINHKALLSSLIFNKQDDVNNELLAYFLTEVIEKYGGVITDKNILTKIETFVYSMVYIKTLDFTRLLEVVDIKF